MLADMPITALPPNSNDEISACRSNHQEISWVIPVCIIMTTHCAHQTIRKANL